MRVRIRKDRYGLMAHVTLWERGEPVAWTTMRPDVSPRSREVTEFKRRMMGLPRKKEGDEITTRSFLGSCMAVIIL